MDKEFEKRYKKAVEAAKLSDKIEPRATNAFYDAKLKRFVIDLTNGATFIFPPSMTEGLAGASTKDLREVTITPSGEGLHWDRLDTDLSLTSLMIGIFGSKTKMSELGRQGGKAKTAAKVQASRENGRKGGRPRRRTG
ncbi:MAG: DUF2442 domain-containing protein [Pyrinomonadaceae bacterium]|mgnify:FL=1